MGGLLAELHEMRCELAREAESQQEASSLLNHHVRHTASLQQLVKHEESAHAALSEAFSKQTHESRERTSELYLALETALSDGLRSVTDHGKQGREELRHMLNSLEA